MRSHQNCSSAHFLVRESDREQRGEREGAKKKEREKNHLPHKNSSPSSSSSSVLNAFTQVLGRSPRRTLAPPEPQRSELKVQGRSRHVSSLLARISIRSAKSRCASATTGAPEALTTRLRAGRPAGRATRRWERLDLQTPLRARPSIHGECDFVCFRSVFLSFLF